MQNEQIERLDWNKQNGLLPVIIQDADNFRVLMLGYMNAEALTKTIQSRRVTFFSRSKNRLWVKGETSGHYLEFISIAADCDADALLVQARPAGSVCHRGTLSCFDDAPFSFIYQLEQIINDRISMPNSVSYTNQLLAQGIKRIAQKVGEEGVETALAAVAGLDSELINESADLLYHLIVLLRSKNLSLIDIAQRLESRHLK